MQVKDIMTLKVLSVEANTGVFEAIRSMLQNKISGLPVVNADGALVGIVTEGDFLRRAETATERRRPRWLQFLMGPGRLADEYVHTHTRKVADVMTPDPYTITPDSSLEWVAIEMAEHKFGSVVVTEHNKVVGVLTTVDALRALQHLLGRSRRRHKRPTAGTPGARPVE